MNFKLLLSLIIITLSFSAFAGKSKSLESQLEKLYKQKSEIIEAIDNDQPKFTLKKIRTRARLYFGVEIPAISKAEIRPEVELFWVKK